jgi:magnesium transporter
MPELDWTFGYPLALAGTGAACLWLYRSLKQRGWILIS